LTEGGHEVVVEDFLMAAPLGAGKALSKGYEAELRHAPWAYELAFGIWYWLPFLVPPLARVLSFFTRRTLLDWAKKSQADVVVSTYPMATQVLGDLRRRAKRRWHKRSALHVPAVNVVTDFGYHPFWAHKDIDLNLAVHPSTVAAVALHTGRPSMAYGPLVGPGLAAAARRRDMQREALGLGPDDLAVLISSGSWGVGAVREALQFIAGQPGIVPVVACGHNTALRHQLDHMVRAAHQRAVVLGWTDDMAGLMAACDVLVENAGGLTALEAMRAGLPIVSFRPIPGHGRKSAAAMVAAGVSRWARDAGHLVSALEQLGPPGPDRQAQLAAATKLFSADAAMAVVQMGVFGAPPLPRLRPVVRVARAASSAALAGALTWLGLTTGVAVAASAGAGVAHPPAGTDNIVFVGVRLGPDELANPVVQQELARLRVSAVLDLNTAEVHRNAVRALATRGVNIESGGLVDTPGEKGAPRAPWSIALCDARSVHQLSVLAGKRVDALVPDRSVNAFDLVDTSSANVVMVVPDTTLPVAPSGPFPRSDLALPQLQGGQIYVVEGQRVTQAQLIVLLDRLRAALARDHLSSAPLSSLQ
jgi:UDP-N-acetylglucosamine:LPS N-acetylglucosamine transferase